MAESKEILFLRNEWSRLGARACPACLYENGKFIRNCKLCEDRHRLREELDKALAEITQLKLKYEKDALVCCDCGGDNVEFMDWIDAKTGKPTHTYEGDSDNNWCRDCESHPRLITREEYEANGRA